ncbi:hypothetical protein BPO_2096 [Bergeyella porcorum]|uniref:Uncharacterized protein n=1 Tax=Bergeyella porcorum TaxID=1735111 RepID=A0AAU0F3T9_9FLAO
MAAFIPGESPPEVRTPIFFTLEFVVIIYFSIDLANLQNKNNENDMKTEKNK